MARCGKPEQEKEKVMGSANAKEISLGEGFGEVALKVNGATVEVHADGSVDAYTAGDVDAWTNASVRVHAAANDSLSVPPIASSDVSRFLRAKATLEIGAVESTGEHNGEIYGGILPSDNKPIWFLAAPKSMDHFNAASWATEQGGALPTRKQGDYLTTLKGRGGAFTELFNRGGSAPAGYVWLAAPYTFYSSLAWCQRLSDGYQYYDDRNIELPVLCVIR
jgi:hypothetical protein